MTTAQEGRGAEFGVADTSREGQSGFRRALAAGRRALPESRLEWLAKALGLYSVGLGLVSLVAPGGLSRLIGVRDHDTSRAALRAVGMREIVSGVGIIARPRPAGWMWSRLAGDTLDLAMLGRSFGDACAERGKLSVATAAVAGLTTLDLIGSLGLSRNGNANGARAAVKVKRAITVNRSPEEVYAFWHDFANLPRFMKHLEAVQVMGAGRSRWRAKAPAGRTVEWEAETIEDRPNESIAWRSLPGADVANSGLVLFRPAPGGRGTEVRVELRYDPPGGKVGQTLAQLLGAEPSQQVPGDLRRFKQVMETGEVIVSEGSLGGTRYPQHPAQPPDEGRQLKEEPL